MADRAERRAHPLDATLAVGKGALFFGERRRRQDHMGRLGSLLEENVLDHQKLEFSHGVLRVRQVRFVEERVFADDIHRLELAPARGLDHRRDR